MKKPNPLRWLLEPLEDGRTFLEKPMFGCLAAYLHGRLMLVLADRGEPWSGVLVPTEREAHESLMAEFPALVPHPVLGKWLYLSQRHDDFEETAGVIVERIQAGDARFGVEPKEKVRGKTKKAPGRRGRGRA